MIMIAGNHDFCFQKYPEECREILSDAGIIYLENDGVTIDGISFWGSPWTPKFGNWAFMKSDEELMKIYEDIPATTDVLITHGPPHGILDLTARWGNDHVGSKSLLHVVQSIVRPKVHIFGHIHEGYGTVKRGMTEFYNVSLMDEYYNFINPPHILEV